MSTSASPHGILESLKYQSSSQGLAEPFLADMEEVFSALDRLTGNDKLYETGEVRPSQENVIWAKQVLLRVLPSHYLRGAEVEPYCGEIHATWEKPDKRVVAFFPQPNLLKVYLEQVVAGSVVHHDLKNSNPAGLSGILAWFFSK
jgi:hypothetical protein